MNADRRQVDSVMNGILAADSQLTTGRVLQRLLNPVATTNELGHNVLGLYNGVDGMIPPPFMGRTFENTENHYIASGNATLDSQDIEDAVKLVTRKGYGITPGSQMLIITNDEECDAVMSWRAGVESRSGEPKAIHDFVPSKDSPVYLTEKNVVGDLAPGDFHGIPLLGSYGESWLLRSPIVPADYVIVASSYGPDHPLNPVGFRSHPLPSYQGLRQIA